MAEPQPEYSTLQGFILGETEKAILLEIYQVNGADLSENPGRKEWLPLSQIKSITRAAPSTEDGEVEYDNVTLKSWLIGKKQIR